MQCVWRIVFNLRGVAGRRGGRDSRGSVAGAGRLGAGGAGDLNGRVLDRGENGGVALGDGNDGAGGAEGSSRGRELGVLRNLGDLGGDTRRLSLDRGRDVDHGGLVGVGGGDDHLAGGGGDGDVGGADADGLRLGRAVRHGRRASGHGDELGLVSSRDDGGVGHDRGGQDNSGDGELHLDWLVLTCRVKRESELVWY